MRVFHLIICQDNAYCTLTYVVITINDGQCDLLEYLYLADQVHKANIISENHTPRLRYICDLIFQSYLGIDYTLSSVFDPSKDTINIRYGQRSKEEDSFSIQSSDLLYENSIRRQNIKVNYVNDLPYPILEVMEDEHRTDKIVDCKVDILAMSFYLLTRYEEYHEGDRDKHGRFKSINSCASKYEFLQIPIVDMWIKRLAKMINKKYHTNWSLSGTFAVKPTIDIDLPYAYNYKGWKKYAGMAKDIVKWNYKNQQARLNNWITGEDPFDTYDWIQTTCKTHDVQPIFFILNNYKKPYDENHLAYSHELSNVILQLEKWATIGIHPSIASNSEKVKIKKEIQWLEQQLQSNVSHSRQHFLRLDMPKTYSALTALNIRDDHSMMYPDAMGYRASTSRPYRWYDLSIEHSEDLTIHPSMTMDVTMRYYNNYAPDEAISVCQSLKESTAAVNGIFSFIWHNSSLSEAYGWQPWKKVFLSLIEDYK